MTLITLQKQHLRIRLKRDSAAFGKEAKTMWDKKICTHILKLLDYQTAHIIALFIPLGSEPDIWPVIRDAWEQKKIVAVPRIAGNTLVFRNITFYPRSCARSFHERYIPGIKAAPIPGILRNSGLKQNIEAGPFGIYQPKLSCPVVPLSSINLFLIPGIAFDKKGYRLGHGKGYYDRLLKTIDTRKIGVCYGFQLFDKLPNNSHDIKVDGVITEKGIDTMI